MFENLSSKLEGIFKKLRRHGKLTEKEIREALREVRLALLEGDVHFSVVKEFTERVREKALGETVLQSLTPGQQVVKIVHEELIALMGGEQSRLQFAPIPPTCIMLVGLQGSGKTTTAAKLAKRLRKEGHYPYLVPADVYRPAAIDQLKILGEELQVPVYPSSPAQDPVEICRQAMREAVQQHADVVIIDTAGRLHIDEQMMAELVTLKQELSPQETLLVADSMTGQDAVNVAKTFHETLGLSGIILTKLDGDARGGAALSIRAVTQTPIKYVGTGEKLDALEPFHPDRIASRILGMGDILSLIEKAEATMSAEKAREMEQKLRKAAFTLEDFKEQLQQVRSMGPLDQLLGMLPGMKQLKNVQVDERELVKIEAIINSMTPQERRHPEIINGSRRKRIARGSGTTVQDVNRLLKQFMQTQKLLKKFSKGKKGKVPLGRLFLG
ncbi:MAG: signal recognition particle protein [Nitrospinota bacterium]|nr:MAG: signal recognition particle protein [Nitrospinota bacterium]